MAVEAFKVDELVDGYRGLPVNDHGKLRIQYFVLTAVTVAGDATSTVDLCDLPPGRVRLIPELSRINVSAHGASRVMKVGHRAYYKRDYVLGATAGEVAEDDDALFSGLDISSAVTAQKFSTATKYDLYSKAGVTLYATVTGGTIPIGATLSGFVVYVYE